MDWQSIWVKYRSGK